jgi:hypothetical protein
MNELSQLDIICLKETWHQSLAFIPHDLDPHYHTSSCHSEELGRLGRFTPTEELRERSSSSPPKRNSSSGLPYIKVITASSSISGT